MCHYKIVGMSSDDTTAASQQHIAPEQETGLDTSQTILLQKLIAELKALNLNIRQLSDSGAAGRTSQHPRSLDETQPGGSTKQDGQLVSKYSSLENPGIVDPQTETSFQQHLDVLEAMPTSETLLSIGQDLEEALAVCSCEIDRDRPVSSTLFFSQPDNTSRGHWTFCDATLVVPKAADSSETFRLRLHSSTQLPPEQTKACREFIKAHWPHAVARSPRCDGKSIGGRDVKPYPFWHVAGVDLPRLRVCFLYTRQTKQHLVFAGQELAHFDTGNNDWWPHSINFPGPDDHTKAGEKVNTNQIWYYPSLSTERHHRKIILH